MEVIKKGKRRKKAHWLKRYKCHGKEADLMTRNSGCGAILLVSQSDLYWTSRMINVRSVVGEDEMENFATFCCPECGEETEVEIPYEVKLLGRRPTKKRKEEIKKHFNSTVEVE